MKLIMCIVNIFYSYFNNKLIFGIKIHNRNLGDKKIEKETNLTPYSHFSREKKTTVNTLV